MLGTTYDKYQSSQWLMNMAPYYCCCCYALRKEYPETSGPWTREISNKNEGMYLWPEVK